MAHYVLVETRSPFDSRDVSYFFELGAELAARGDDVTLFLAQNAVLAVRKAAANNPLDALLGRVTVMADAYSLRERAVASDERSDQVTVAEIDDLVDLMMSDDDTRVMWH